MTDRRSTPVETPRPLSLIRLEEGLAREPKGYARDVALLAHGALCVAARALRDAPRTTASGWSLRNLAVEGGGLLHLSYGEEAWSLRLRFEPSRKPSLGRYLSQITVSCQSADLGELPHNSGDMVAAMVTTRDQGSLATSLPSSQVWPPGMGPVILKPFRILGEALREAGLGAEIASVARDLPVVSAPYSHLFAAGAAAIKKDGGVPGPAWEAVTLAFDEARAAPPPALDPDLEFQP